MYRDAAISLSLANLCFIKVWAKLLSGFGAYFNDFPIANASIIADVLLLAAVFFVGMRLARRTRSKTLVRLANWSFLFSVLVILNAATLLLLVLSKINFSLALGRNPAYFTGLAATAILMVSVIKSRRFILTFGPRALLILSPFVLITFSQAVWRMSRDVGLAHAESKRQLFDNISRRKPATRVLWIIFDEFDQRMAFTERPADLNLPELDAFRSQSTFAKNAYPPAPLTYMSMPALITGRLVAQITPVSADELMINFDAHEDAVRWSQQPNVFSEARKAGFTTGLAGWCHPYCEVIGNSISKCNEVREKQPENITLKESMLTQAEMLASSIPFVPQASIPFIQRVSFANQIVTRGERKKYQIRYQGVLEAALKAATDSDLDLILVHSPAPHPPGIYDRKTNSFSLNSRSSYVDNLALVDRTLHDLRNAMQEKGLWETTTVIISADHWWRTEMWARGPFWTPTDAALAGSTMDHRIPFLIKLAGQQEQITYDPGFNTVLTHDLILSLMRGEISHPTDIVEWLNTHRSLTDSPYNRDELLP